MAGDGVDELRKLGVALRASGDKVVRKEVLRSLKDAAGPAGDKVRASAGDYLPSRLAGLAAATKVSAQVRMSGRQAGVKLRGRGVLKKLDDLDRGSLRHPLFGDRGWWYAQSVRPGWWSEPIERQAPQVRDGLEKAIADGLRRAVR